MLNGPRKIILINAGRYDYAEVELSESLQIVGPNNTGKTTLINTLQFLYLDDLRTMDFGSYSLEQSLAYYFPSQYSYALFECLGVMGIFTVGWRGQSKAAGGDPERFLYFAPYVSDDFFNEKQQVREPREVNSRLSLKQFRKIKSAQEHRELLLPPVGPDGRGMGIVPMRHAERYRQFRESLKDLLSLSSITQDQMRDRLLTLADVRTDIPALDVRRLFGEDYDRIRRLRDGVTRFKKHEEQVRLLVQRFHELLGLRDELVTRWTDLRLKRKAFEEAHNNRLAELGERISAQDKVIEEIARDTAAHNTERDDTIGKKGALAAQLTELATQSKAFADFDVELARVGEQNIKREELRLTKCLSEAETETREKAQQKVDLYSDLVEQKKQTIENFDRLIVTSLRQHLSDDKLGRAFRILNFDLLETPVGTDGATVRDEHTLLALIREVAKRVRDGTYVDDAVEIVLQPTRRSMDELGDVSALREKLDDETATLRRWEAILKTVVERERVTKNLRKCQTELAEIQRQIFGYEQFIKGRANEARLKNQLKETEQVIRKLNETIEALEQKRTTAEDLRRNAKTSIVNEEDCFNQVMGRFGRCVFPEFEAKGVQLPDIPEDFDSAIALFLRQQDAEERLREKVTDSLKSVAALVGENFNGADDSETVRNLSAELEALPDKVEALERDWNALIQGLRGTFAGILKELDAVRSVVTDLNRQFARVQVSNLQTIKLEVLESTDIVSWVKRLVDLQQPGLFDDDTRLDETLRNFRQKFESSPLISYAQLFSLQFTVVGEDGAPHHHHDFRQIESHGTTITIKVLFNLLVLRRYLREDQSVVPFFLDEIQLLDLANRAAVLSTARKLGFLAITAAPEAISEVDSLYFLQPRQGRIVLRQRHRINVKLGQAPA